MHQPLDCLGAVAKGDAAADADPVSESDLSRLFMVRAGVGTVSSSGNKKVKKLKEYCDENKYSHFD